MTDKTNRAYLNSELMLIMKQIHIHVRVSDAEGKRRPRYKAIQRLCLQAYNICKRLKRGRGETLALNYHWYTEQMLRKEILKTRVRLAQP